jgi:hypothetical protein
MGNKSGTPTPSAPASAGRSSILGSRMPSSQCEIAAFPMSVCFPSLSRERNRENFSASCGWVMFRWIRRRRRCAATCPRHVVRSGPRGLRPMRPCYRPPRRRFHNDDDFERSACSNRGGLDTLGHRSSRPDRDCEKGRDRVRAPGPLGLDVSNREAVPMPIILLVQAGIPTRYDARESIKQQGPRGGLAFFITRG